MHIQEKMQKNTVSNKAVERDQVGVLHEHNHIKSHLLTPSCTDTGKY